MLFLVPAQFTVGVYRKRFIGSVLYEKKSGTLQDGDRVRST